MTREPWMMRVYGPNPPRETGLPENCGKPTDEMAKGLVEYFPNDGKEHAVAVAIDAHGKPLAVGHLGTGTVDACITAPRDVYAFALTVPITRFVGFAHNHPSGDVTPSEQDSKASTALAMSGTMLGIDLLWSIVVDVETGKWALVPIGSKKPRPEPKGDDAGSPPPPEDDEEGDERDGRDDAEEDDQPGDSEPTGDPEEDRSDQPKDDRTPGDKAEDDEDEDEPEEGGIEYPEDDDHDGDANPDGDYSAGTDTSIDEVKAALKRAVERGRRRS